MSLCEKSATSPAGAYDRTLASVNLPLAPLPPPLAVLLAGSGAGKVNAPEEPEEPEAEGAGEAPVAAAGSLWSTVGVEARERRRAAVMAELLLLLLEVEEEEETVVAGRSSGEAAADECGDTPDAVTASTVPLAPAPELAAESGSGEQGVTTEVRTLMTSAHRSR